MGGINYYKPGDWSVTCDSCGKKMKASHSKHRWDGFIVCNQCWEPRHSHDFIKVKYIINSHIFYVDTDTNSRFIFCGTNKCFFGKSSFI